MSWFELIHNVKFKLIVKVPFEVVKSFKKWHIFPIETFIIVIYRATKNTLFNCDNKLKGT